MPTRPCRCTAESQAVIHRASGIEVDEAWLDPFLALMEGVYAIGEAVIEKYPTCGAVITTQIVSITGRHPVGAPAFVHGRVAAFEANPSGRARKKLGLTNDTPTLHMSFTGNPGTGKTTVAMKMATILHRLGYVRKGHLVTVTRDDLVGQYIGHTAPKTKEVLKKAMGGVLFIDEAYYLYRPENERDYGQEAIEILLQIMENNRDDLVVILAGYADRMNKFFESNPGFRSRIAHHIDFPDYSDGELLRIADVMLESQGYKLSSAARIALGDYIPARRAQSHFANARSLRNALDRARMRQAKRLFDTATGPLDAAALSMIEESDIRASRVFRGGLDEPLGANSERVGS
ncbi:MAG: AAA family ATPase [Parvularculaceae bacterium]